MARINSAMLNKERPLTAVLGLPYMFNLIEQMKQVEDGHLGQQVLDACAPTGYVGLAFYDSGERSVYATKPIRALSDMKNLRFSKKRWHSLAQEDQMLILEATRESVPLTRRFWRVREDETLKAVVSAGTVIVPERDATGLHKFISSSQQKALFQAIRKMK